MWWKKNKKSNNIQVVEVTAIGGDICPKCNEEGGLFHYDEFWNSDGIPFYQCENCNAVITDEEFDRLKLMKERKEKLNKLK